MRKSGNVYPASKALIALALMIGSLAVGGCQSQQAEPNNPATTVPATAPANPEAQKAGGSGMPLPPGK